MGKNPYDDRRKYTRYNVMGTLRAAMTFEGDSKRDPIGFFVVDVSSKGIGFLSDVEIEKGGVVTLTIDAVAMPPFKLRMAWILRADCGTHAFRCGAQLIDQGWDLSAVFRSIDGVWLEDPE